MKELENIQKDTIKIHAESEKKKEIKFLGSQRKIKGLKLWEFNLDTKELKEAEYKKERMVLPGLKALPNKKAIRRQVEIKENGIYIQALNRENALRKLRNRIKINI